MYVKISVPVIYMDARPSGNTPAESVKLTKLATTPVHGYGKKQKLTHMVTINA